MRFPLLLLTLLLAGCSASREGVRVEMGAEEKNEQRMLPGDAVAVVMIRRLEIEPLGGEATRMRQALFAWMVGSERLRGFDAVTGPIDGLESSSNSYREELMLQFLFGGAGWVVRSDSSDLAAQQEAGIRSMLAAYKNMTRADASLADPFLDKLDEIRRLGELRAYILRKNRAE